MTKKGAEPHECNTCKFGSNYKNGYDATTMNDECGGCCSWNDKWQSNEDKELDFLPHKKIPVNLTITKISEHEMKDGAE
jgi:epoxyqueuosine reductase QueG